ncbi:MAG TPA: 2,3-bisphosphoglycerate-independent phosphoglycerate mutase [Clostridiales bacterium UBA8153]|nr:2,3-bisphosphoglycerate-independent phosphoglycerate mutase [Clostridiales bacterium UBA8153]
MTGANLRPVALIVLDGWGLAPPGPNNAVSEAGRTLARLSLSYPSTRLAADGEAVGLMSGQMGDSNVGHLNLGAGRVVLQDLVRINRSIAAGEFQRNPALLAPMARVARKGRTLHLMGLLSDGGVHSHEGHFYALLGMAKELGVEEVAVHAFLDGRDVSPDSGATYLRRLSEVMTGAGTGRFATVGGRYYAMDRDRRWDRTRRAFLAVAAGEGERARSAMEALAAAYARGEQDEFVPPTVIGDYPGARPGDAAILVNFRADRARQLARALAAPEFEHFPRPCWLPMDLTGMTQYEEELGLPYAFPRLCVEATLGEVVSRAGLTQLRLAETEKYAHVTYFFNGMSEKVFPGEVRQLIPSPPVATYDLQPEMSAPAVTAAFIRAIRSGRYDLIIANYANPDMVGHTGVLEAAKRAVAVVDDGVAEVVNALLEQGGAALIVSDHGNAECMADGAGHPYTAHTSNPVPCILVDPGRRHCRLRPGVLGEVAPTIIEIMGLDKPQAMTGASLISCGGESL